MNLQEVVDAANKLSAAGKLEFRTVTGGSLFESVGPFERVTDSVQARPFTRGGYLVYSGRLDFGHDPDYGWYGGPSMRRLRTVDDLLQAAAELPPRTRRVELRVIGTESCGDPRVCLEGDSMKWGCVGRWLARAGIELQPGETLELYAEVPVVEPVRFERYASGCCWVNEEAPTCLAALENLRPGEWLRWDEATEARWLDEPGARPDHIIRIQGGARGGFHYFGYPP